MLVLSSVDNLLKYAYIIFQKGVYDLSTKHANFGEGCRSVLKSNLLVMLRIYLPRVVKHFCRFLPLPLNGARASSLFCLVFGFLLCFGLIFLFFCCFDVF